MEAATAIAASRDSERTARATSGSFVSTYGPDHPAAARCRSYYGDPGPHATTATSPASATTSSTGISNGAIWALVALGYTLVYGIIELINFAHGDVFMIGSFIAVGAVRRRSG